jgi:PAS domain-containing protein
MIHEDDRDILRQTINAALASGRGYDLVVRQLRADGNHREVLLKGQPIFDAEGYTIELYGVMMPIPD